MGEEMIYHDAIYGETYLPDIVGAIANTPEVQRLRYISQDSIPRSCLPWGAASRFEHDHGVSYLSTRVVRRNKLPEREAFLFPIASLLHDVGNPCFSHLSEPFLKQVTGKDGESFLGDILHRTQTETILKRCGFSVEEVVHYVTGNAKPYSIFLNGSIDIDNLDNVNRYWFMSQNGEVLFDAPRLASSFIFNETTQEWELDDDCFEEAQKWQEARIKVYGLIYDSPHQNACMMLYRALAIAFSKAQLPVWFFRLNDDEALEYLRNHHPLTIGLANRVAERQWYPEVFCFETTTPPQQFKDVCGRWDARTLIADTLCEWLQIPRTAICAYMGKGKDKRRIQLPFVAKDGSRRLDHDDHDPIYRLKVYLDPEYEHKKEELVRFAQKLIY